MSIVPLVTIVQSTADTNERHMGENKRITCIVHGAPVRLNCMQGTGARELSVSLRAAICRLWGMQSL